MPRTSPVYYIAPSDITITPNANNSAHDLAVYIARDTKIKVYCPAETELDMVDANYQEWTLAGRNRRLADYAKAAEEWKPYTIYARLNKQDKNNGYLVFAAKQNDGGEEDEEIVWRDKYRYVTREGGTAGEGDEVDDNYWYVRLGEVTLPDNNMRTVILDTGILGTEQYNNEWASGMATLPQRIDLLCQIGGKTMSAVPYVFWGETLVLTARLIEGWNIDVSTRVRKWSIERNTGNAGADAEWNAIDRSGLGGFGTTGQISIRHLRNNDDFADSSAAVFTVTAWGEPESHETEEEEEEEEIVLPVIATASITVLAESSSILANASVQIVDRGMWSNNPVAIYVGPGGTYTPDETLPEGSPYGRPVTVTDGQPVADPYHFQTISCVTWLQFRLDRTYATMTDRELMQQILTRWASGIVLEISRVQWSNIQWNCLVDCTSGVPHYGCSDWAVFGTPTMDVRIWNKKSYELLFQDEVRDDFADGATYQMQMRVYHGEEDITLNDSDEQRFSFALSRDDGNAGFAQAYANASNGVSLPSGAVFGGMVTIDGTTYDMRRWTRPTRPGEHAMAVVSPVGTVSVTISGAPEGYVVNAALLTLDKAIPKIEDSGAWVDSGDYHANSAIISQAWNYGILWQCTADGTHEEPSFGCNDWTPVGGNNVLSLGALSSRGYMFRRGAVETTITSYLYFGNEEISAKVAAENWNWTRTSEHPTPDSTTRDQTWNAAHSHLKTLDLSNTDMDITWSSVNKQIFTLTISVNDGNSTVIVENQIIS